MTPPRRRVGLLVAPALAGAALAALTWALAPRSRVYLLVSPALLVLLAGLLLSAVAAAAAGVRHAHRSRTQAEVMDARIAAEQARRRFVGRLDHELKNPLTALLTALAAPDVDRAGRVDARVVTAAGTQAERMRRLLTDLRRVADVETAPLDLGPVDVAALLADAVQLVESDTAGVRPIHLTVPAAPRPLPTIRGDGDLLLVAVHNVLSNAVKYSRPGDAVEVRAREATDPPGQVIVEVADSGPGIPAEDIPSVWEELARGRTATGVPGSGIGLALVRIILARHGGTATLDSRAGAGTSVTLHLPLTGPEPAPARS